LLSGPQPRNSWLRAVPKAVPLSDEALVEALVKAPRTLWLSYLVHSRSRELIHNHGKICVKRGEWVHDNSSDAKKIEAVFASLATIQLK
jgi:hypothetical protein